MRHTTRTRWSKFARSFCIGVVSLMFATGAAYAQTVLPGRAHAPIAPPGQARIGLFAPAGYVVHPCVEVEVHPLLFLAAPHASVKIAHWRSGTWHLSGDYGLAFPWLAQKLLQGYLFPSFQRGTGSVGFTVVPSAGALLSRVSTTRIVTIKIDAALGIALSHSDLRPLEAPAPLEMLFAPILNRYRIRAGLLFEQMLHARWHARLYGDAFLHGVDSDREATPLDHLTVRMGTGIDTALTRHLYLSVDLMVWNNNQFARDARGNPVRSTDVLPFLDLRWTW